MAKRKPRVSRSTGKKRSKKTPAKAKPSKPTTRKGTQRAKANRSPDKTHRKRPSVSAAKKPTPKGASRKSRSRKLPGKAKPKSKAKTKGPKGFRGLIKDSLQSAMESIKHRLELAKGHLSDSLPNAVGRVRVHPYADGTVDGELLVTVPRGTTTRDLLIDMEDAVGRHAMTGGYWINFGVRFTIKEDDQVYRRFRGYNDVNTHYQKATATNFGEVPKIARDVIASGMEHKYGRKSDSVYVRIHWNPDGTKPETRD